jgi:alpha-D-xyloside xylohydrolase
MPVYVKYGAEIPMYPEDVNCTDEMDLTKVVKIRFDENNKAIY